MLQRELSLSTMKRHRIARITLTDLEFSFIYVPRRLRRHHRQYRNLSYRSEKMIAHTGIGLTGDRIMTANEESEKKKRRLCAN